MYSVINITQLPSHPRRKRNGICFVFSVHLKKPTVELKCAELQLSVDNHKAKVSAARAVAYLNPILRWAQKRDLVVGEFNLEKPILDMPKQRFLDETELAAILPFLGDSRGMCARFILLTGARISAATKATWSQINWDAKTWNDSVSFKEGEIYFDTDGASNKYVGLITSNVKGTLIATF